MDDLKKFKIINAAKQWGCKIEDPLSFMEHYGRFQSYQFVTYLYFLVMIILFIGVLL